MEDTVAKTIVVLCADDFGFSQGTSKGIIELVEAGRLSAVGCMTTTQNFQHSGPILKRFSGHIDIGLHFVLTDLSPLGIMPSLAPNGTLPPVAALMKAAITHRLPLHEVSDELNCQIDTFVEVMGQLPDFIDGHHHVHQLPGIRDQVIEAAKSRFGASSPWLRACNERPNVILKRAVSIGRALAIGWYGAAFRRRAWNADLRVNIGFSGVYDFSNCIPYYTLFDRFTDHLLPGALVMCHPGRVDDELRALDSLTDQREIELEYFLSPLFAALLEQKNLRLGRLEHAAQSIT